MCVWLHVCVCCCYYCSDTLLKFGRRFLFFYKGHKYMCDLENSKKENRGVVKRGIWDGPEPRSLHGPRRLPPFGTYLRY